ncbi:MAG: MoaD/ThiS family protein [Helicobacter sp.]|nr:MoaD/ThiS family protein [Helicobacter sp.]
MNIKVEFLGPLAREAWHVNVDNLKELRFLLRRDDEILAWLDECAIVINDEIITNLDYPLVEGDVVMLLPPVCGG